MQQVWFFVFKEMVNLIYGYVRVSTKTQARDGNSLEEQSARILERYPGAEIVSESMSGAAFRPEFEAWG